METRFVLRATQSIRYPLRNLKIRLSSSNGKSFNQQANPIGDYYASILDSSIPTTPSKPPTTATPNTDFETKSVDTTPEPSILFSSRLSSPLERRSEIQRKSVLVAGIWVPPRPDEPENCCMSGCVNCVWDRYGEELEAWVFAKKEADQALRKEKGLEKGRKKRRQTVSGMGLMLGEAEKGAVHTAVSTGDDGGGSESKWGTGLETDFMSEDVFRGVPVGIREFMKQEKRLKEKHARDGTSGG